MGDLLGRLCTNSSVQQPRIHGFLTLLNLYHCINKSQHMKNNQPCNIMVSFFCCHDGNMQLFFFFPFVFVEKKYFLATSLPFSTPCSCLTLVNMMFGSSQCVCVEYQGQVVAVLFFLLHVLGENVYSANRVYTYERICVVTKKGQKQTSHFLEYVFLSNYFFSLNTAQLACFMFNLHGIFEERNYITN